MTRETRLFGSPGEEIAVVVRSSPRTVRARLVVRSDAVPEVVLPAAEGDHAVGRLLAEHETWLRRVLARARDRADRSTCLGLDRTGVVWTGGRPLEVVHVPTRRPVARLAGDRLHVGGDEKEAAGAVERWYRRHARSVVAAAVHREAARLALHPTRVAVRDQRTRWGSCAGTGTLSFNWRLVLAPAAILDYVVVHPSLPMSGETLRIEESVTLRARLETRGCWRSRRMEPRLGMWLPLAAKTGEP